MLSIMSAIYKTPLLTSFLSLFIHSFIILTFFSISPIKLKKNPHFCAFQFSFWEDIINQSTSNMAVLRNNSKSLELTMSVNPGLSSSSSSAGGRVNSGHVVVKRDIDINRIPSEIESEYCAEEEEQEENEGPPRKKLRLTKEQSFLLEETFRQNHALNPKQKEVLAMHLKLKARQVEVWFQNRRARSKLKQTEMDCEYLKRWFSSLTEQNKRLQKEVEELRAIKLDPPTTISYHTCDLLPSSCDLISSSTIRMCLQCQRVTTAVLNHNRDITASATTPTLLNPMILAKDEKN